MADDDALRLKRYPGDNGSRQPVHTVYVPADRVHPGLAAEWSEGARGALAEHAGSPERLAEAKQLLGEEATAG